MTEDQVEHLWELGHHYSPVPDTRELAREPVRSRVWPATPRAMAGVDWREGEQLALLKRLLKQFPLQLPRSPTGDSREYHGSNDFLCLTDAWILQAMLRDLRPSRLIEIGGGWSSLLTARVNREFLAGAVEFTCIEPSPPDFLTAEIDGISQLRESPVQELPVKTFEELREGDVLFIDTSHVAKTGGDVPYLYHEVLPRLHRGVVVHIHDIFLPRDYPERWVLQGRGWNEQYLVQSFLAFNDSYEVLLAAAWLSDEHPDLLATAVGDLTERGGSLWLRRANPGLSLPRPRVSASAAEPLAVEVRRRLGPTPPLPPDPPLVSIVLTSHNGVDYLRALLAGLVEQTDYPRLELIAVDNGSSDGSVAFLCAAEAPFPISIVANRHNESFSDANNQGAALARGELLLFLNNDAEPFEAGWLRELVACLDGSSAAAVGATLVSPHEDLDRFPLGFAVQHRGLRFRDEKGVLGPVLHDWEADPLDDRLGEDIEAPVVVAACLLVEAALFEQIGGFTRGYLYGCEDIDICLKLRAARGPTVCSGRSLLIHQPGSTRRAVEFERARERKLRNHQLLRERWGPRLRREHDRDALAGAGIWVQRGRQDGAAASTLSEAEALSICVRASEPPSSDDRSDEIERLRSDVTARGHRCLVLCGDAIDDPRGLECDVAVHVRGPRRYVPAPGQFNVLWAPERRDDLTGAECDLYDLVVTGDAGQAIRLRTASATPLEVLPGDGVLDAALTAAQASGRPTQIDS